MHLEVARRKENKYQKTHDWFRKLLLVLSKKKWSFSDVTRNERLLQKYAKLTIQLFTLEIICIVMLTDKIIIIFLKSMGTNIAFKQ